MFVCLLLCGFNYWICWGLGRWVISFYLTDKSSITSRECSTVMAVGLVVALGFECAVGLCPFRFEESFGSVVIFSLSVDITSGSSNMG